MIAVEETEACVSVELVFSSEDLWANQRCMLLPCLKRDSRPCANLFIITPVMRMRRTHYKISVQGFIYYIIPLSSIPLCSIIQWYHSHTDHPDPRCSQRNGPFEDFVDQKLHTKQYKLSLLISHFSVHSSSPSAAWKHQSSSVSVAREQPCQSKRFSSPSGYPAESVRPHS